VSECFRVLIVTLLMIADARDAGDGFPVRTCDTSAAAVTRDEAAVLRRPGLGISLESDAGPSDITCDDLNDDTCIVFADKACDSSTAGITRDEAAVSRIPDFDGLSMECDAGPSDITCDAINIGDDGSVLAGDTCDAPTASLRDETAIFRMPGLEVSLESDARPSDITRDVIKKGVRAEVAGTGDVASTKPAFSEFVRLLKWCRLGFLTNDLLECVLFVASSHVANGVTSFP
jgi:hypothetical protein